MYNTCFYKINRNYFKLKNKLEILIEHTLSSTILFQVKFGHSFYKKIKKRKEMWFCITDSFSRVLSMLHLKIKSNTYFYKIYTTCTFLVLSCRGLFEKSHNSKSIQYFAKSF